MPGYLSNKRFDIIESKVYRDSMLESLTIDANDLGNPYEYVTYTRCPYDYACGDTYIHIYDITS